MFFSGKKLRHVVSKTQSFPFPKIVFRQLNKLKILFFMILLFFVGGALASMASTLLVTQKLVDPKNLALYTYGQPRVGDYNYSQLHGKNFFV